MIASMIVDAHAHVFGRSAHRGADPLAPAQRQAPAEELLELMTDAGVHQAVLVALDTDDQAVAEALARHPGRFAGVAVATDTELGRADSGDPVGALLARRTRWPFDALRTSWLGEPNRPLRDSPAMPLLRRLAADGVVLWTYLPPDQFGLLEQLVVALPELRVVLNHLGFCPHDMWVDEHRRPRFDNPLRPELVRRLVALAEAPQVYLLVSGQYALSTAAPPYPDLFELTRVLAAAYSPDRLLWGSDHPWPSRVPGYRTLLELVDAALPELSPAQHAQVLGGTARSLLPSLTSVQS